MRLHAAPDRARGRRRSAPRRPSPARACWRRSPRPTSSLLPPSATRSSASAPSSPCPASARRWPTPAHPVVGPVPDRRRRAGARHGRQGARRDRRRDHRRGRRPALRRRELLDGWLVDTSDADAVAGGRGGRHPLPRRAAADDRPRRGRRRWPARRWPSPRRCGDARDCAARSGRRDGLPEVAAGDDLADADRTATADRPPAPTATSSSSPPRSVVQGRGPGRPAGPRGGDRRRDRAASSPGAGRPGSSRPGTAW